MTGVQLGWLLGAIVIVAVATLIGVWLLGLFYRRASAMRSFVRTGFRGRKVIMDGGALVLPVIHEVIPINMNTLRLEVRCERDLAVITRNRMRVDVVAAFYVRVTPTREAVARAAQSLGRRTMDAAELNDLMAGKFVGALRSVAAAMTLEEMHEQRGEYVARVRELVAADVAVDGLELEAVSLTDMDQTSMEFFDPSNMFDAEGLTLLTEQIERRKKMRNDIEQETMIQIRSKNLETEKRALEIDREAEYARLDQEREVETRRAAQVAEVTRERAARERESEEAQIGARLEIERARIAQERAIEQERIARQRDIERLEIERRESLEIAEQQRTVAVAAKSQERIGAEARAEEAEIQARLAVERVRIHQERALEEERIARERDIQRLEVARRQALEEAEIQAREEIERARIVMERLLDEARIARERDTERLEIERRQAVEIAEQDRAIAIARKSKERSEALVDAEGARAKAVAAEEKVFSVREAEVAERRRQIDMIMARLDAEREGLRLRLAAEAEKDAAGDRAEAARLVAEGDAEADKLRALAAKLRFEIEAEGRRLMNEAANALDADARATEVRKQLIDRLEGIVRESVRPLERIEGIKILQVDGLVPHAGGGSGGGGGGSVPDDLVSSALRFRAQAPLVDSLLRELGISGTGIGGVAETIAGSVVPPAEGR